MSLAPEITMLHYLLTFSRKIEKKKANEYERVGGDKKIMKRNDHDIYTHIRKKNKQPNTNRKHFFFLR